MKKRKTKHSPQRAVPKSAQVAREAVMREDVPTANLLPVPVKKLSQAAIDNRGKYSSEEQRQAVAAYLGGESAASICERLKISNATIYYWREKYSPTSGRGKGSSTPKKTAGEVLSVSPASVAARDATVYLRQAKKHLIGGIRSGKVNDFDDVALLAMLALRCLSGADS